MKAVKFRIANNSKFCIKGSNGKLKDIFPSSTLFSAIINNISLIYGNDKATKAIEQFAEGYFNISSMFIGLDFYNIGTNEIENTLYFVPKPEAMIENIDIDEKKLEENVIKRKEAKKIKMISLQALKKIGDSWIDKEKVFNFDLFEFVNIGSDLACTEEEKKSIDIDTNILRELSFVDDLIKPHVKLNRRTNASNNFFFEDEKVYRYEYVGKYRIEPFMYFMYTGKLLPEIKSGINLLVDEGIGGKRSVGMGSFISNNYVDINVIDNVNSSIFIILSSYVPLKEELDSLLGYKIEKANGYIYENGGQPFRKKSIGTIKEGAIVSKKVIGQLVDVTPLKAEIPHKIYYNGKNFSIGIGDDKNG